LLRIVGSENDIHKKQTKYFTYHVFMFSLFICKHTLDIVINYPPPGVRILIDTLFYGACLIRGIWTEIYSNTTTWQITQPMLLEISSRCFRNSTVTILGWFIHKEFICLNSGIYSWRQNTCHTCDARSWPFPSNCSYSQFFPEIYVADGNLVPSVGHAHTFGIVRLVNGTPPLLI
jgi:hypothetical protein